MEQSNKINFVSTMLNITSIQPSNFGVYECSAGIVDGDVVTNSTDLCVIGKNK